MNEHFYRTGDLVVMTSRDYINIKAGAVGIVTGINGNLINVALPQGTWAFPKYELKPLTKETK